MVGSGQCEVCGASCGGYGTGRFCGESCKNKHCATSAAESRRQGGLELESLEESESEEESEDDEDGEAEDREAAARANEALVARRIVAGERSSQYVGVTWRPSQRKWECR
eukprot:COSAG04_NODE_5902_length_1459_cov_2.886029_2_plen_109_part_01